MSRPATPTALPAGLGVVYQCPECEARYLNERRCPDCALFCRRLDLGGHCPHCDEPVTLADLAEPAIDPTPRAEVTPQTR
jgi:hypothetical protein